MSSPNAPADPLKEMHPVRRTITDGPINIAQPGDYVHKDTVERYGLKIGTGDDADVGPVGSDPVQVVEPEIEVRYDKPVVPPAGPLGTTGGRPTSGATVEPAKDEAKSTTRKSAKDE